MTGIRRAKKRVSSIILSAALVLLFLAGCGKDGANDKKPEGEPSDDTAAIAEVEKYAFIPKSKDDPIDIKEAEGFARAIEAAGKKAVIGYPEKRTADAQTAQIQLMISQGVKGICIAANDERRLKTALGEAEDLGITICSADSELDKSQRSVHVTQTGTHETAVALAEAVLELADGEGEWAILTADLKAEREGAWIDEMKEVMASDAKYSSLKLIEVAYGNNDVKTAQEQAKNLVENYPDLKVICSLTTLGTVSAAIALTDTETTVKLTGLGYPSELKEYIGDDETHHCPCVFLWNPENLGALGAHTIMALCDGRITGASGEKFSCPLGDFVIGDAAGGGTEIILGEPYRFDPSNIDEWAQVY